MRFSSVLPNLVGQGAGLRPSIASLRSEEPDDLLAIYLRDHLAAATVGLELATRLTESNMDDPRFSGVLAEVRDEIAGERELLVDLMKDLGVSPNPVKVAAGWLGEKAARLKLNGQLAGYSPLSRMIELEALSTGIAGKSRMWKVFTHRIGPSYKRFDFADLADLADSQRARIDELHVLAGEWISATEPSRAAK